MITDRELMCSIDQAITGDANSTDVIDTSIARDLGRGHPMRVRAQVTTTFTSGGAGTLNIQFVESAAAALTSPNVLLQTGALALATLVAGYIALDAVLPRTSLQYLGFIYDNGTAVFTAGKVTAGLVEATETPMADRPSNYNTGF